MFLVLSVSHPAGTARSTFRSDIAPFVRPICTGVAPRRLRKIDSYPPANLIRDWGFLPENIRIESLAIMTLKFVFCLTQKPRRRLVTTSTRPNHQGITINIFPNDCVCARGEGVGGSLPVPGSGDEAARAFN